MRRTIDQLPLVLSGDIIRDYQRGYSITSIKKKWNITPSIVAQIFEEHSVSRRPTRGPHNIPYNLDHDYFFKINTPAKAYLLGFMYADGSVATMSNAVSLGSNDLEILDFFKKELKCDKPFETNSAIKQHQHLTVNSPTMKRDLINLGCMPLKTFKAAFPSAQALPSELTRHFLRGLLDGDGCVYRGKCNIVYFLGTKILIDGVQERLSAADVKTNKPMMDGKICRLRITGKTDLINLYKFLYEGEIFSLSRKRKKFEAIVESYGYLHF